MASRVERPSLGNTATAESDPALHFLSARSAASLSATLRSWQLRFSHDPGVGERHDDMKVAIHDAFRAAHRQLEDMLRKQHGRVKTHEVAPHGVIKSLFQDHGFIAASDDHEVYFHRNSVAAGGFDGLSVGERVSFSEETGDKGEQATFVRPLRNHNTD